MARVSPIPTNIPQIVLVRLIAIPRAEIPVRNLAQHRQLRFDRIARRQFKLTSQKLMRAATAEAHRVFREAFPDNEIWSHAFEFEGQQFLLSARIQPAREFSAAPMTLADDSKCPTNKALPARVIIEVVPAPSCLARRTLTRMSRALAGFQSKANDPFSVRG